MTSPILVPTLPWDKATEGKHSVEVCSGDSKFVGTIQFASANVVVCAKDEVPDDQPVLGTVFYGAKGPGASLRLSYRKGSVAIDVDSVTFS